jgi:hypothetical protein
MHQYHSEGLLIDEKDNVVEEFFPPHIPYHLIPSSVIGLQFFQFPYQQDFNVTAEPDSEPWFPLIFSSIPTFIGTGLGGSAAVKGIRGASGKLKQRNKFRKASPRTGKQLPDISGPRINPVRKSNRIKVIQKSSAVRGATQKKKKRTYSYTAPKRSSATKKKAAHKSSSRKVEIHKGKTKTSKKSVTYTEKTSGRKKASKKKSKKSMGRKRGR